MHLIQNPSDLEQREESRKSIEKLIRCQEQMTQQLDTVNSTMQEMSEVLAAWRNARGAIKTIQVLADICRWTAYLAVSIGAIWYFLKTGVWKT